MAVSSQKVGYDLPFIPNKGVYAAVMWARKQIREGTNIPAVAISLAANYYKVEKKEVAHYVGLAANRVRARRRERNRQPEAGSRNACHPPSSGVCI